VSHVKVTQRPAGRRSSATVGRKLLGNCETGRDRSSSLLRPDIGCGDSRPSVCDVLKDAGGDSERLEKKAGSYSLSIAAARGPMPAKLHGPFELVPSCNSQRTVALWRYAPTTRNVLPE